MLYDLIQFNLAEKSSCQSPLEENHTVETSNGTNAQLEEVSRISNMLHFINFFYYLFVAEARLQIVFR